MKVVFIDFYDSFTYNIIDLLESLGAKVELFHAFVPKEIQAELVVLGPGPGKPKFYPAVFSWLETNITKFPILGICLGHQFIGQIFGAKLVHAKKPMHGKIDKIFHRQEGIFQGLSEVIVTRYHSLVLEDIPNDFIIEGWSKTNEVMAISHKIYPILGLQFHPESCACPIGRTLLRNFIEKIQS